MVQPLSSHTDHRISVGFVFLGRLLQMLHVTIFREVTGQGPLHSLAHPDMTLVIGCSWQLSVRM